MKLKGYWVVTGEIECLTGLRVGGISARMEIGGVDNPVIRDTKGFPYIPGSSIKGKMRSLLEWYLGKFNSRTGKPCSCKEPKCPICRIFGTSAGDMDISTAQERGPGRLIVRDAHLTRRAKKELKALKEKTGLNYAEVKYENTINRLNSSAVPRPMERVPAGATFDFELIYRIFELEGSSKEDQDQFDNIVKKGLKLLEREALGGSVSRGYGKVAFTGRGKGNENPTINKCGREESLMLNKVEL